MTADLSRVELYLSDARKAAADGLTWTEFGELLVAFLKVAMAMYDEVASMTGDQKKAAVLAGVGRLFDVAADNCIPLVLWPVWGLARGPVRLLVLALASGAIEQLLPLVRVR
jgi:hypothetical protein